MFGKSSLRAYAYPYCKHDEIVLISMVRSQYREAITTLTYVPVYMMEHPEFAYKETEFNVFLNGVRACKGTLLDTKKSTSEYA